MDFDKGRVLPHHREGIMREIPYREKVYQPRKGTSETAIHSRRRNGGRRLFVGRRGDSIIKPNGKHEPCSGLQDVGNELSGYSEK